VWKFVLSYKVQLLIFFSKKTALRKGKRLDASFYQREDVVQISKDLLGKVLVTFFDNIKTAGIIVETEAYRGPDDKACHAYNNRLTDRTKIMYKNGGLVYVYLCYGIHHLFNVVTAKEGMAHAVLIRAIEPLEEIETMLERRNLDQLKPQLTAGPGVMSKSLGITTANTGTNLTLLNSKIWIEDHKIAVNPKNIIESPRVGVAYAEECADWNWRFRIAGNKWTSKAE
jgi:DNA-3-methyladenine glycosylase